MGRASARVVEMTMRGGSTRVIVMIMENTSAGIVLVTSRGTHACIAAMTLYGWPEVMSLLVLQIYLKGGHKEDEDHGPVEKAHDPKGFETTKHADQDHSWT